MDEQRTDEMTDDERAEMEAQMDASLIVGYEEDGEPIFQGELR